MVIFRRSWGWIQHCSSSGALILLTNYWWICYLLYMVDVIPASDLLLQFMKLKGNVSASTDLLITLVNNFPFMCLILSIIRQYQLLWCTETCIKILLDKKKVLFYGSLFFLYVLCLHRARTKTYNFLLALRWLG